MRRTSEPNEDPPLVPYFPSSSPISPTMSNIEDILSTYVQPPLAKEPKIEIVDIEDLDKENPSSPIYTFSYF